MSINPNNMDDYSPAKTLLTFDNPIPLLRHPIKSPQNNDSPILCFKNPKSFASSYISCESNITQQCEAGARIACSETASRNCAPPWWKTLIPNDNKQQEMVEREKCEEREMQECLDSARLSCRKFAEDKCLPAFRDARVLIESNSAGWDCDGSVKKSVVGLIGNVCFGEKSCVRGYELGISGGESWSDIRSRIGVRIVRGSDLLDKEFR